MEADHSDMALMETMTAELIRDNVCKRLQRGVIYTKVSDILISMNPYADIPGLYESNQFEAFHYQVASSAISSLEPHIFGLGRRVFQGAVGHGMRRQDQSVIVSGESGAGKTEATKMLLRYIAQMCANVAATYATFSKDGEVQSLKLEAQALEESTDKDSLEERIMSTNPVLEAFGNAKTLRNDNSSRFGKWISLEVDAHPIIVGAKISKYLLEESRITSQAMGERNFNIFYQVCAGAPGENYDPKNFFYLNQSNCTAIEGVNDAEAFAEVVEALRCLGFGAAERLTIFNIIKAILHLGNAEFVTQKGSDAIEVTSGSRVHVKTAADLLGIAKEELEQCLCSQVLLSARGTLIKKKRDLAVAASTRDSISKYLYDQLFEYLVFRINQSISSISPSNKTEAKDSSVTTIGILDIFGFENFDVNSLEQLCINYANEKLQNFFFNFLVVQQLAMYTGEGIHVPDMNLEGNTECVKLLEGPAGIFSLLADELSMPKGTDSTVLDKYYQQLGKHPNFMKPKVGGQPEFTIVHYAQPVTYQITGFLEKNKQKVTEDIFTVFGASKQPLIASFFKKTSMKTKKTGGEEFRRSLGSLLDSIRATCPHFIRCIKPNNDKLPGVIDKPAVLNQLVTSGIIDAVKVRQHGFALHMLHAHFLQEFSVCIMSSLAPSTPKEKAHFMALSPVGQAEALLQLANLPESGRQVGTTRVFLKQTAYDQLEQVRLQLLSKAAVRIQRRARGVIARRRLRARKQLLSAMRACLKSKKWADLALLVHQATTVGLPPKLVHEIMMQKKAIVGADLAHGSLLEVLQASYTTLTERQAAVFQTMNSASEVATSLALPGHLFLANPRPPSKDTHYLVRSLLSCQRMHAENAAYLTKLKALSANPAATLEQVRQLSEEMEQAVPFQYRGIEMEPTALEIVVSSHLALLEGPELEECFTAVQAWEEQERQKVEMEKQRVLEEERKQQEEEARAEAQRQDELRRRKIEQDRQEELVRQEQARRLEQEAAEARKLEQQAEARRLEQEAAEARRKEHEAAQEAQRLEQEAEARRLEKEAEARRLEKEAEARRLAEAQKLEAEARRKEHEAAEAARLKQAVAESQQVSAVTAATEETGAEEAGRREYLEPETPRRDSTISEPLSPVVPNPARDAELARISERAARVEKERAIYLKRAAELRAAAQKKEQEAREAWQQRLKRERQEALLAEKAAAMQEQRPDEKDDAKPVAIQSAEPKKLHPRPSIKPNRRLHQKYMNMFDKEVLDHHLTYNRRIAYTEGVRIFGGDLEGAIAVSPFPVPLIMIDLINYILANGLKEEGIFRLSGHATRVKELQALYDAHQDVLLDNPIDAASLLKQYLRDLPSPLIPYRLYNTFLDANQIQEESAKMAKFRQLLGSELPAHHRESLAYLMEFVNFVGEHADENKMTPHNLAVVFAPNLLQSEDPSRITSDSKITISCIEYIINNHATLFPAVDVLDAKKSSMQELLADPTLEQNLVAKQTMMMKAGKAPRHPGPGLLRVEIHGGSELLESSQPALRVQCAGMEWVSSAAKRGWAPEWKFKLKARIQDPSGEALRITVTDEKNDGAILGEIMFLVFDIATVRGNQKDGKLIRRVFRLRGRPSCKGLLDMSLSYLSDSEASRLARLMNKKVKTATREITAKELQIVVKDQDSSLRKAPSRSNSSANLMGKK